MLEAAGKAIVMENGTVANFVSLLPQLSALAAQNGQLGMPDEVRRATERYEADSDKIRCFADDCLEKVDGAEERTADVYRAFRIWCRDNGYHPEGMRAFKQLLLSFAQVVRKRPKSGGSLTTILLGYKLVSDFLDNRC